MGSRSLGLAFVERSFNPVEHPRSQHKWMDRKDLRFRCCSGFPDKALKPGLLDRCKNRIKCKKEAWC